MQVHKVSLHNVRSYGLADFEFDPNVTLILGPNGSGKTTILEAVYLLMRGTSFRGRDRDVIPHTSDAAELKLDLSGASPRKVRLAANGAKSVKSFVVESSGSARLHPKHKLPVVLFEPMNFGSSRVVRSDGAILSTASSPGSAQPILLC